MPEIFDSKIGKKIEFNPLKKGKVSMYVCGPTVYDVAHLGHGRSAVSFDVIRRYLEYKGYEVTYVSNYTDIDDKMIKRANEEGVSVAELAAKIIPEYEADYEKLGIKKPTVLPKATETIPEIIELIKKLEKKGFIYPIEGDGIYFDVSKFPKYGELSGQKLDDLKMGSRVDVNENKRNPYDFVLWKFKKEGEPAWESPWGEGRPGWHVECSAMTWKHLGEKFDIHGGGMDLKFPHHECEIAQSCAAFGDGAFAQHWMHNGFITIDNEKMSKSLGNFFTLKEIFEKYDPQVVRLMYLQTHYRSPINFSQVLLTQAKNALERLHGFVRTSEYLEVKEGTVKEKLGEKYRANFEKSMDNDFDTSGALGAVFGLISEINSSKNLNKGELVEVIECVKEMDKVLGVIFSEEEILDAEVEELIGKREEARTNKDFKTSDKIRDKLKAKGILLEDTPNGTIWKKA